MDRRWSARKRLQKRVTLEAPHIGSIAVDMCDVSLGGAFVDTVPVILPRNAPVVIAFKFPSSKRNNGFRLDAIVVRRVSTGVGLMFLQMQTEVIRELSSALSRYSMPSLKLKRSKNA